MENEVLRIREVSQLLGVSNAAIRSACKRGDIPTITLPGVWLIPKAAVEAMIQKKIEKGE